MDSRTAQQNQAMGQRIRATRHARGLTQTTLGERLGVSYQQVQKYEAGTTAVSSAGLVLLGRALSISPLDLLGVTETATRPAFDWDLLTQPGAAELAAAFRRVTKAGSRRMIAQLAERLANAVPKKA
jgi:transcriptional regulator with XRE-family HTH domain